MRIVLTGATGFVGSEILQQVLSRPEITAVTCISRRPVGIQHRKVRNILHSDFTSCPGKLAEGMAEHGALIWALGAKVSDVSDAAEYERATVTSTLVFAGALAHRLSHPFRFCYLSGMGADPGESSRFPWQRMTRHLKGRAERGLEKLASGFALFRATSFRPAGILPRSAARWMDRLLSPITVRVDRLANAMIDEALSECATPYRVISNGLIRGSAKSRRDR